MPSARFNFDVVPIGNRLVVLGGEGPFGGPVDDVDVYDPVADAWSRLASLAQPVEGAGAVSLDGTLWVAGLVGPREAREIVLQSLPLTSTLYVHRKLSAAESEPATLPDRDLS